MHRLHAVAYPVREIDCICVEESLQPAARSFATVTDAIKRHDTVHRVSVRRNVHICC